jgi:hypothetical protein
MTVSPDDPVFHALQVMSDANVGAVLVLDGEQLVGIFSERDYARKVILLRQGVERHSGARNHDRQGALCDPRPDGRRVHGDHDRKTLPPPAGSRRRGQGHRIVSIGDVVKETICEQQFIIQQMAKYITG